MAVRDLQKLPLRGGSWIDLEYTWQNVVGDWRKNSLEVPSGQGSHAKS
jgi:hypothetical protein